MRPSLLILSVCLSSTLLAQGVGVEGEPPVVPGTAPPATTSVVTPGPRALGPILPAVHATTMGNAANSIPWSWTPTHFMQPFLGSEMPKGLVINCMGYRTNNRSDTGATINMEIWLGYTTKTATTVSTSYATNWDSGTPVQVYNRKNFVVPNMIPNTDPTFFQGQIKFDKPFVWVQQTNRNLLWEAKIHSNTAGNRSFSYFPDNSSRLTGTTTTRLYSNNNANATTAFVTRNFGPILTFTSGCGTVPAVVSPYGKGCRGSGGFAGRVLPGGLATNWGTSNNYFGVGASNMRYQQIMDGADMGTGPKTITALHYRQDDRTTGRAGGTQNVEIKLGQSDKTYLSIGRTFDDNFDSKGSKQVFSGTVNIPTQTGRNTDLGKFWLYAKFTTPYVWVPIPGKDILIELVNRSTTRVLSFQDADSFFPISSRIYNSTSSSAKDASAGTRWYGLVMALAVQGGTGNAIPGISATGRPVIGTTFKVNVSQARRNTAAVLGIGASRTSWNGLTLPFDLTVVNMPGCFLNAGLDIMQPTATDTKGDASVSLPVPKDTTLVKANFYTQWLIVDPSNKFGLVWTAGNANTIGDF